MRISDLQTALAAFKEKHGDLSVVSGLVNVVKNEGEEDGYEISVLCPSAMIHVLDEDVYPGSPKVLFLGALIEDEPN